MTPEQYAAGMVWLTQAYEADHGAGSAAILPPGFLQMLLTFLMSLLGGTCLPPAPTPTPASVKAAAVQNVGFIEAKCILALGFKLWRSHGKTALASALKGVAAMDEAPAGLLAQAIAANGD